MAVSEMLAKILISVGVILGIAFSGAISNEFGKTVLSVNEKDLYIPYSQLYFNMSWYVLIYPVYIIYAVFFLKKTVSETFHEDSLIFGKQGFQILHVLKYIVPFFVAAVLNTYAYARGLAKISASAAGVLIGLGPVVVFIESLIILKEKFLIRKVFATLFVFGGVIAISFDKQFTGDLLGIILVLAAAAGFGTYNVIFKKIFGRIPLGKVCLWMTCIGSFNVVFNIIPTVILVKTDVDRIGWEYIPWGNLIGAGILNLVNNFLTNFGVALLNPLVVSIGLMLGLPVTNAYDIIFRHYILEYKFIIAVVLMLCSFVLIAIPIEEIWQKRKQKNTIRDVNMDHERSAVKDDLSSDSGSTKSTMPVKDTYDMKDQNDDYENNSNKRDYFNEIL